MSRSSLMTRFQLDHGLNVLFPAQEDFVSGVRGAAAENHRLNLKNFFPTAVHRVQFRCRNASGIIRSSYKCSRKPWNDPATGRATRPCHAHKGNLNRGPLRVSRIEPIRFTAAVGTEDQQPRRVLLNLVCLVHRRKFVNAPKDHVCVLANEPLASTGDLRETAGSQQGVVCRMLSQTPQRPPVWPGDDGSSSRSTGTFSPPGCSASDYSTNS